MRRIFHANRDHDADAALASTQSRAGIKISLFAAIDKVSGHDDHRRDVGRGTPQKFFWSQSDVSLPLSLLPSSVHDYDKT